MTWRVRQSAIALLLTGHFVGLSAGVTFITVATSCSLPNMGSGSTDLYRIPWQQPDGTYKLSDVEIKSLKDPAHLMGDDAQIVIDPDIDYGTITAGGAVGRFLINNDGVRVPLDASTLSAVSLYAHTEKLKEIDDALGVSSALHWPSLIALQTTVQPNSLLNNALYDGHVDTLFVVPYNQRLLPISMNAGIIGHEHFHKIFQSLVLNAMAPLGQVTAQSIAEFASASDCAAVQAESATDEPMVDEPGAEAVEHRIVRAKIDLWQAAAAKVPVSVYNAFVLRAINEGLADFWAWVYTGDTAFIGRSLSGSENSFRRLDQKSRELPSSLMLRLSLLDSQLNVIKPSQRIHLAYRLGTYFARELYLLAHAQKAATSVLPNRSMTITQRFNLAKTVIANLSRVRLLGSATLAQKDLSPHELFQAMIERPDALDADSCSRLQDFMRNAPVGFVMHRCATAVLNIGNNLNRTNSSNSSNQ